MPHLSPSPALPDRDDRCIMLGSTQEPRDDDSRIVLRLLNVLRQIPSVVKTNDWFDPNPSEALEDDELEGEEVYEGRWTYRTDVQPVVIKICDALTDVVRQLGRILALDTALDRACEKELGDQSLREYLLELRDHVTSGGKRALEPERIASMCRLLELADLGSMESVLRTTQASRRPEPEPPPTSAVGQKTERPKPPEQTLEQAVDQVLSKSDTDSGPVARDGDAQASSDPKLHRARAKRKEWLAEAMLLVRDHPDWSDAMIAREVGVSPSTLSRDETYRAAAGMARRQGGRVPRGHSTTDPESGQRGLEAYDDPDPD